MYIYICASVEEQKCTHMCTCMKLCVDKPRLACKFQKSSMYIYTYICICFAKSQIVGTRARGYVCDWL